MKNKLLFGFLFLTNFMCSTIILWDLNDVLLIKSRTLDPFLYQEKENFDDLLSRFKVVKRLMPGMLQLVADLHKCGYTQHIGSNISPRAFAYLSNPLKSPHLKTLFSYIDLTKSVTYMYEFGHIIKKPSRRFFDKYLEKNSLNPYTEEIIFIDDKLINVQAARSVGMKGLQFKNSAQLRINLAKIGIKLS